jgi:hypothetical protein
MALLKVTPKPPANQPEEWSEILRLDPTPRSGLVTGISAAGVSLLALSILLGAGVVLLQPFFLLFHDTHYPNLATFAFATISLASGWLGLLVAMLVLQRIIRPARRILKWVFIILAALITIYFFALLFVEFRNWLLGPEGWARFVQAWVDLVEGIIR